MLLENGVRREKADGLHLREDSVLLTTNRRMEYFFAFESLLVFRINFNVNEIIVNS